MRTETWANHEIRFVENNNEWWAVLSDVANALELRTSKLVQRLPDEVLLKYPITDSLKRKQETVIVNEIGIYKAIFKSRKPEAETFQDWTFNVLKELRQSSGLEGFEIFRTLDKEHQKDMMATLQQGLKEAKRVDFIKANTITNKAVSTMYGHAKSVKKGDMTPEMLIDREPILEDTVKLISARDAFDMDISVSKMVYGKYADRSPTNPPRPIRAREEKPYQYGKACGRGAEIGLLIVD